MDNVLYNQELQLSRFGAYLLKQQMVREGHERYYVFWVRKFLSRRIAVPIPSFGDRITGYLEELQASGSYKDWQISQAEKAVRLFMVNFQKSADAMAPVSPSVQPNQAGAYAGATVLDTMMTILRMKHYSYTTERTYLGWVKRFLDYPVKPGIRPASANTTCRPTESRSTWPIWRPGTMWRPQPRTRRSAPCCSSPAKSCIRIWVRWNMPCGPNGGTDCPWC